MMSVKQMLNWKLLLAFVAVVTLSAYAILWNNSSQDPEQALPKKLLQQFLTARSAYEGHFAWEATGIARGKIEPQLVRKDLQGQYRLLVFIRSLECMSCYNFHVGHIAAIHAAFALPIIIVADSHYAKFVARDLPRAKFVIDTEPRDIGFLVFMLDASGKVLYADLPDPNFYEESKMFYQTIEHLLAKTVPSS
jgi:hypothetical protein